MSVKVNRQPNFTLKWLVKLDKRLVLVYNRYMNKQRTVDAEKLRKARGLLTLSDVGKRIGVTRQQVWCYENGRSLPSVERMIMLLDLYNLKLESVLTTKP